ncbi:hypothetical protein V6N13_134704 [Hibiscus sabdariffa]
MVGKKKREAFSYYLDRFNNWSVRWLSMEDILEALFDEEQVATICAIPLSKSGICDEIIWRLDGSGHYPVKSGYRLLRGDLPAAANVSVHAYSSLVTRFFNEMWSVNLPAKVKINMWRIANSFVPTFATLQSRRLNVINICPLCRSSGESIAHLMRDCCFVRQLFSIQAFICENAAVCSPLSQGVLDEPVSW